MKFLLDKVEKEEFGLAVMDKVALMVHLLLGQLILIITILQ